MDPSVCVICKKVHGSCTKCSKCSTYYHAMCASRAGYRMELHSLERNGKPLTRMVSYCAYHRAPNPDTILVIQTPLGTFSAKSLVSNKKRTGSRLISSKKTEIPEEPAIGADQVDSLSAARCRVFKRLKNKRRGEHAIAHRLMGPRHHSFDKIERLKVSKDERDPQSFSTTRERLYHLQRTENDRVCLVDLGCMDARPILRDKERLEELADPSLSGKYPKDDFVRVCTIAAACVAPEANQRPTMGEVVQSLKMVQRITEYQEYVLTTSNARTNLRQSRWDIFNVFLWPFLKSNRLSAFDNETISRTAVFSEDLQEG